MPRNPEYTFLYTIALNTLDRLLEEIRELDRTIAFHRDKLKTAIDRKADLSASASQLRQDIAWLENPEPKLEMGHERRTGDHQEGNPEGAGGEAGAT